MLNVLFFVQIKVEIHVNAIIDDYVVRVRTDPGKFWKKALVLEKSWNSKVVFLEILLSG